MKLVLATQNQGKIKEFKAFFKNHPLSILAESDFKTKPVAETASTFVENALIKARHVASCTDLPALADDSGLVVPALNGAPGLYSARYAAMSATSKENIAKLLSALIDKKGAARQAYFYCVIVVLMHPTDPAPLIAEGRFYGEILEQPQGEAGFGYDPVFFIPHLQKSAAELTLTHKNKISHRGIALQTLLPQLLELL